jgi:competence protein ComEA
MPLTDRFVLAGIGGALLLAGAAGWVLLSPGTTTPTGPSPEPSAAIGTDNPFSSESASPSASTELVVDVEGAVAEPGIQRLPAGSRIADAIVAAGGFSAEADVALASRQLNLAALLSDGQQVYVPRQGDATGTAGGSGSAPAASPGGPVNLNQASPEQLDALPGIGPVTVQKIVAARQEQPFRTLDELVERKVLTSSQLAKIRDLVTV